MSQVKCAAVRKGGEAVDVVAGWDRPLREFFLNIFVAGSMDETVWTDLLMSPALKRETTLLKLKLEEYGIAVPDGFWERVERREGNVMYEFDAEGWKSISF